MRTLLFCLLCFAATVGATAAGAAESAPRILVVGDSLSAAYGLAEESGWVARLEDRLAAGDHDYSVVNASTSGATTADGTRTLERALDRHAPAIVIIQLGGNDGLRGLDTAAMESNLDTMIERARAADARVLLLGVRLPPNYGSAYRERFEAVHERVADRHDIAFVPRMLAGFDGRRDLFLDDGIHPSADGQRHILDNVWPALEPLLAGAGD